MSNPLTLAIPTSKTPPTGPATSAVAVADNPRGEVGDVASAFSDIPKIWGFLFKIAKKNESLEEENKELNHRFENYKDSTDEKLRGLQRKVFALEGGGGGIGSGGVGTAGARGAGGDLVLRSPRARGKEARDSAKPYPTRRRSS
ncbi:hypothetical protein M427DRAFT_60332 [Gonapodya prolifera JEL478]|uniref:Uncharacterized protein n=1 Tax=Gonapodya prolifera (strain JEL478) TaxID=1344416 RepID=A0A139A4J1_GONPJ|nr:hypothetical protein M427DRAFT_60332 [Gonapodya prolifera JEL478]|eukprot:KXS11736.1 hypothetical protein M427DRAFT_60332 [Gonapodya prolifera JEL478]